MRKLPGKNLFALLTALVLTTGCGSESNTGQTTPGEPDTTSGLEFPLPVAVRQSLAVDFDQVSGFVNVNGRNFEMQRSGDRYSIDIPSIPVNSDVDIDLRFIESLANGGQLTLAETSPQTISISQSDQTIEFFQSQYLFPDDDSDGISNIEERNNETDPFTPEIAGTRTVVVQFDIPQLIQNPAITQVIALFSDVPRPVRALDASVEIAGIVSTGIAIDVDIRLIQQFLGQEVLIADATELLDGGIDDVTLVLSDDNFDFSIDSDDDGITNLNELQQGTNPFLAN